MKELKEQLENMLRLFLDSIRDYEHENKERICLDERDSEEFVKIFIESEDGFDYRDILNSIKEPIKQDKGIEEKCNKCGYFIHPKNKRCLNIDCENY